VQGYNPCAGFLYKVSTRSLYKKQDAAETADLAGRAVRAAKSLALL
jgi:hypothetical protein